MRENDPHFNKELEARIQKKVLSGRYASTTEVIEKALDRLDADEEEHERELAGIAEKIEEGLDALADGAVLTPAESKRRTDEVIRAHSRKAQ